MLYVSASRSSARGKCRCSRFARRTRLTPNAAAHRPKCATKKLGEDPVILMRGHGDTVVGSSVREATIRVIYTHINAQALSP
jgi:hypothetical protein